MFGWHEIASIEIFWGSAILSVLALLTSLIWGARRFEWPSRAQATEKVDEQLSGRPIAAIADSQVIGAGDAQSEAVWQAHMVRMQERTKSATSVKPNLKISDRDPYGVRFIAMLFLACALFSGSVPVSYTHLTLPTIPLV